jgi:hypothetical protein
MSVDFYTQSSLHNCEIIMKTRSDVATYLTNAIHLSGKSNIQIAAEAGFPNPNIVSMVKSGRTPMPMARIPALAKAMGTDPKILLDGCLAAYHPELHKVISALAPSMLISRGELSVIRALRHAVRTGSVA